MEIKEGIENADLEAARAMLDRSYWAQGIPLERVRRAAENTTMVLSAWEDGQMVGYARVLSDKTEFGYFSDVIVHEDFRGMGIGRAMVKHALDHPDFQGFRRWVLVTLDAHGVYEKLGFHALDFPDRYMEIRLNKCC